jgi:lactoylglutathione lyase
MLENTTTTNMILYCREWDKTVQFYRDGLHLPVTFSTDWFVEFRLSADSRVSIADERRSSIGSCGGNGITLAIEVETIDAIHEEAETTGLGPTGIRTHPWGARVFYLFDPEGHRIEIWQAHPVPSVSGRGHGTSK